MNGNIYPIGAWIAAIVFFFGAWKVTGREVLLVEAKVLAATLVAALAVAGLLLVVTL